jgi:DNA polymerase-3 subunit beta
MEFIIHKSELAKLIHLTAAISEKKKTNPILGNILISAKDGIVTLLASDSSLSAVARAKAKVVSQGATTLPAKMFSELVRELPDCEITVKLGERERVEFIGDNARLKLMGISAVEFPIPKVLDVTSKSKIAAPVLLEMINKTVHAISNDDGRINMSGLCVELVKHGPDQRALRMVATDGHRLALITRAVPGLDFSQLVQKGDVIDSGNNQNQGAKLDHIIIPRKAITEIRKLLDVAGDAEVGMDIVEGLLVIESVDCKLITALIDNDFPNYDAVIPKSEGTKITVLGSQLEHALRRVALVVSGDNKAVRFDLFDNIMRISSSSPELGEGLDEVPISYKGQNISIGFNARYMCEALSTVNSDQPAILELSGDSGPAKVYSENDDSAFGIIMPLRL